MRQTEGTKLSLQGDPQRYDVDTFLTILYVPVDDFGKSRPSSRPSGSALDERGDYLGALGANGANFRANAPFIAMPSATCSPPFQRCLLAVSSIVCCAATTTPLWL